MIPPQKSELRARAAEFEGKDLVHEQPMAGAPFSGQQLVLRPTQEYGTVGPSFEVRSNAAAIVVLENLRRVAAAIAPGVNANFGVPAEYGMTISQRTTANLELFMQNLAALSTVVAPPAVARFQPLKT